VKCQISLGYGFHKIEKMEKKWISDFLGVGYRYTDIVMNVLLLYSDRKLAIKVWNENIHWWPDDQIVLRFIEDGDQYWFILYQRGKNLFSKENVGFFKKNQLTQNYLRFKENFDQKTILRFSLYKSVENKTNDKDETENNKNVYKRNSPGFELNIFKRFKTIYDVKFQNKSQIDSNSVEASLIKNPGPKYA
jgi:hypothetical protein